MTEGSGEQQTISNIDDMRKWEKRADDLAFEQLPQIRAKAEKWVTTISTLTGLTSVLALLQGRDDISALTQEAEIIVGILLGLALSAAIAAIYYGALASQGTPQNILNDPVSVRNWYSQSAQKAANQLKWSRLLAVLTVLFLASAIYITWFGPVEPDATTNSNMLVVNQLGNVVCGSLVTAPSGLLALNSTSKTGQFIALDNVISLTTIDKCP
jgi:hypothetical protein